VLVPDQFTSSSCHLRDAVVEDEEQVGPGSHHSSTSFWPGWSSGPSVSVMQTARAGAAARRAHSRPATKSVELVGLTVVEIIEASHSREAPEQVLCHVECQFADSRRAFETGVTVSTLTRCVPS